MDVTRLIERCRQGDADALGELYKAYAQRMRVVCRRYISDEQAVEDVLHDAFVIIFTSFDRLRDNRKAESWMMSITRNVASKYKDHLNSRSLVPLADAELLVAPNEEACVKGVPLEEVIKLIDKLPEGYGRVFRLSVFEGLSHKEIAAMLGIEPHSSSSQLARAKKMLRKMMQQYWAAILLLLIPLTIFLLRKDDTIEKPDIAKQEETPKQNTKESSTKQAQEPVIVQLPIYHSTNSTNTLQPVVAEVISSIMPDTLTNMMSQEQTIPDSTLNIEQADTAHLLEKVNLPHYDIATLFHGSSVASSQNKHRWSINLAYAGGMGEQNASHPYGFTETPTLAISGEPLSPITFENWSDYAAFLAENPDDGSKHSRSVIMNIALNNANQPGNDKIMRTSHHYMPFTWSLAMRYTLSNRFGLESGLNYSRLTSDFEMGADGNVICEQQSIH